MLSLGICHILKNEHHLPNSLAQHLRCLKLALPFRRDLIFGSTRVSPKLQIPQSDPLMDKLVENHRHMLYLNLKIL